VTPSVTAPLDTNLSDATDAATYIAPGGVFTALHGNECWRGIAIRILSIRLSVRQNRDLWQNERRMCPDFFIPYERSLSLVFRDEEWLVGVSLLPENWGQSPPPPLERNRRFLTDSLLTLQPYNTKQKSSINAI